MTTISIVPSFEQTQHSSEILPKQSCEISKVFHIIMIIITGLATIGAVITSVITGILPLLSICSLAIPLLLISIFLLRRSCLQTKTPTRTDIKSFPKSLPPLIEINENTKHTKILEQYGEVITDWNSLPGIFGETTPSLLNKAWKIKHSKTALFATTGVIYSPRVHCCCNLLIALENNTSISNLDALNIFCEIPTIQEGQCISIPWKNSDGSSNKKKLGLPNFLGFIQGPDPESHNHHPVVAFALAQTAYTNCLNEAVNQGADMIQVPLISTAPPQLSQNPQEAASWKSAIQTGLVAALAKFATSNPETIMNVVVVSSPGLGLPL
ncbi:hypothetical protein C834K_0449 [Chlamydia poikilotherma]|uniref:Macro domain-containing protein n=1 Tax=Chlamydia poikilotherma TaxID=1967783 RepID=A0A3B0PRW1_9CHLA|nr:hypothetical protein [Chlamydia poikilotherma]SYX08908.1 hypothetical protein C834K_0449 [Chlamydia poikilotherma]